MPRLDKYTLGTKIDDLFCDLIELLLDASYTSKDLKFNLIIKACVKLDALKYFLKIAWELKILDNPKYISLSTVLSEVGKMLGGWKKQTQHMSS